MEANVGGESRRSCGPGTGDFALRDDWVAAGRKSVDWDVNDWRWDGNLFLARPVNPAVPSDCRGKQLLPPSQRVAGASGPPVGSGSSSREADLRGGRGEGESEKRSWVAAVGNGELNGDAEALTLKLGGNGYTVTDVDGANWGERSGKKTKLPEGNPSRAVCQVMDCGADLSSAKDYHRRHKVCEAHSKASQALVGNVMQRFCQQCSRFHLIQEFDEGKRSCRRRLAGHNRRRRKSQPDAVAGSSSNDDQMSSYLLISLLRILSNLHSNSSDQAKDQDFLSHLLSSLASLGSVFDGRNLSTLLKDSKQIGNSPEAEPPVVSNANCVTAQNLSRPLCTGVEEPLARPVDHTSVTIASLRTAQKEIIQHENEHLPSMNVANKLPVTESLPSKVEAPVERVKLNNIDLNDIYNDSQDCDYVGGSEKRRFPADLASSFDFPSWLPQDSRLSSPTQPSGNSDSASAQSPSSSNGDAQSRTDRIVFKLFGKDPNEFPLALRSQILEWLSHSPTDIESYIRPGCIVLTIYIRLPESTWKELCYGLGSCLNRLLNASNDAFWTTGWVYAKLRHQMAFVYDGQVVLDAPLLLRSQNCSSIVSVTPIAVCASQRATFVVKGFNLCRSTTRLLCALDGDYVTQDILESSTEDNDTAEEHDVLPGLFFSCSIPNVTGRGFIEVDDHGISNSFFPFIVAEEDVCSEIRKLESAILVDGHRGRRIDELEARNSALDFVNEMGWLLRRSHLRSKLDRSLPDIFPFRRFKWLIEFSMDNDWCAVVKKLLDIFFEGTVDAGTHSSVELALLDMGLLHRAVRRNCSPMVELLLRYAPDKKLPHGQNVHGDSKSFLFRPDAHGPAGVTPLHIAASSSDMESVLDSLTNDPGKVGIEAWKTARDSTGFAPEAYARLRGHFSYIRLVQKKSNKISETGHVVLDIPSGISKTVKEQNSGKLTGFEISKSQLVGIQSIRPCCKICSRPLIAYGSGNQSLVYRPAMLCMVAIAAVCVCVALFFHGPPEVLCVFPPFRWELLKYGAI